LKVREKTDGCSGQTDEQTDTTEFITVFANTVGKTRARVDGVEPPVIQSINPLLM